MLVNLSENLLQNLKTSSGFSGSVYIPDKGVVTASGVKGGSTTSSASTVMTNKGDLSATSTLGQGSTAGSAVAIKKGSEVVTATSTLGQGSIAASAVVADTNKGTVGVASVSGSGTPVAAVFAAAPKLL